MDAKSEAIDAEQALKLSWAFGFNSTSLGGVVNLTSVLSASKRVLYVVSNTAVIHDIYNGRQIMLQGHRNAITSLCVSDDKQYVVTADGGNLEEGDPGLIIIWDTESGEPIKVLEPSAAGVEALDMSPDGKTLVALSNGSPQTISVWEWEIDDAAPVCSHTIGGGMKYQAKVRFNPINLHEVVSNSEQDIAFWVWDEGSMVPDSPANPLKKFRKGVGSLLQSTFIPYTSKVVTGTSAGELVIWDAVTVDGNARHAIKLIHTGQNSQASINVLGVIDRYLYCGFSDGVVRFYDFQFRVVGWFEEIRAGQITSVSFAQSARPTTSASVMMTAPSYDNFSVDDFIVATVEGMIVECSASMLGDSGSGRMGRIISRGFDGAANCLVCHPEKPFVIVGLSSGTLEVWNYEAHSLVNAHRFKNPISALAISANGDTMAIGFGNGALKILSFAAILEDVGDLDSDYQGEHRSAQTFRHRSSGGSSNCNRVAYTGEGGSNTCITKMAFSADGRWLATSDVDRCVAVYRYSHFEPQTQKEIDSHLPPNEIKETWTYIGRHRAHRGAVVGVMFDHTLPGEDEIRTEQRQLQAARQNSAAMRAAGLRLNKKERDRLLKGQFSFFVPRLISLGEDGVLQEYDLLHSCIRNGLLLKYTTRVEADGVPTAALLGSLFDMLPYAAESDEQKEKDGVLMATDEYKMKVICSADALPVRARPELAPEAAASKDEDGSGSEKGDEEEESEAKHDSQDTKFSFTCRTTMSPTYGGPVSNLMILSGNQHVVYTTKRQVVGLMKLPLSGSPAESIAVIGHAGEIADACLTKEGKYLITCGGEDRCLKLWCVETSVLADPELARPEVFVDLLDGGAEGQMYKELIEYFYFCQLRSQGLQNSQPRRITGRIQLQELANMMRALGYYPSEKAIKDLTTEVLFGGTLAHPSLPQHEASTIDLDLFIQLFINYRPIRPLERNDFEKSFQSVLRLDQEYEAEDGTEEAPHGDNSNTVSFETLVDVLHTRGEVMTEDEILQCLIALMGPDPELPDRTSAEEFTREVLGFQVSAQT